jgi:hypothetical protein
MARLTSTIDVPHPAALVFRVATRIPDLPRWLPEVVSAELLDPELVAGARVLLRLGPATGNAQLTGVVERVEAPSLLEIRGSGGPLTIAVRTALAATGPASTRAVLDLEITAPPLLGFIVNEVERRIGAELPASLERLRALLDAEAAGA